jgi:hypothetical protein
MGAYVNDDSIAFGHQGDRPAIHSLWGHMADTKAVGTA